MKVKTVAVASIGCKVSQYEAQAIGQHLIVSGFALVDFSDTADAYIINTCAVTNSGDKKSRQLIRKAIRQNQDAVIVVTGCYSQTNPETVMAIDGVDLIFGTNNLADIAGALSSFEKGIQQQHVLNIRDANTFEELPVEKTTGRSRAYVKIQDGCEQYCSYCIIPYARGPIRSRLPENIQSEIMRLSKNGVKEIILTGIHVASYGKDLDHITLIDIIKMAGRIEGIKRIRLSSLEPTVIDEGFLDALAATGKFCPHFHLSLQSGSNRVLSAMNRKYTTADYQNALSLILRVFPTAAIWTDVITGFPGETDIDFEEALDFIAQSGICRMHVFPYAPKEGTPAAKWPNQVDKALKSERSLRLRNLSDQLYHDFLTENIGKTAQVLIESIDKEGTMHGHTENYIDTFVRKGDKSLINTVKDVYLAKKCPSGCIEGKL